MRVVEGEIASHDELVDGRRRRRARVLLRGG
jgi:hypothetical protein